MSLDPQIVATVGVLFMAVAVGWFFSAVGTGRKRGGPDERATTQPIRPQRVPVPPTRPPLRAPLPPAPLRRIPPPAPAPSALRGPPPPQAPAPPPRPAARPGFDPAGVTASTDDLSLDAPGLSTSVDTDSLSLDPAGVTAPPGPAADPRSPSSDISAAWRAASAWGIPAGAVPSAVLEPPRGQVPESLRAGPTGPACAPAAASPQTLALPRLGERPAAGLPAAPPPAGARGPAPAPTATPPSVARSPLPRLPGAEALAPGDDVAPPLATSAVLRMQQELRRAGVLPPEDSSAGAGAGMGGADEDLTLPAPQVDVADTPLRQQLSRAGLHRGGDAAWFFATKIGLALVLSLGSLALLDPLALSPNGKLLFAAAGAMVGFVLPTAILDLRVQDRQRRLRSQLPDYIDMIVTCLEAGMGLDRAVQRATVELRSYAPDLCEELSITVGQWSAGFDRMAAVAELRRRTGLEDLAEFMGAVEEAGRHGSTITDALRQQAEFMRKGEAARQEAWAKRVPTLVIVLVLIFIVPPAFVVLLGSSVVQAVRLLWPALQ